MTTAPPAGPVAGPELLGSAVGELTAALATLGASLTPAGAQPGDDQVPGVFPRAVVATVEGAVGRIGLLVGDELLATVPGTTDLATAVTPALQALAGALGGRLGQVQEIAPADFTSALGGSWSVVPLIGQAFAAGVAATDTLLGAGDVAAAAVAAPSVSPSAVTHEPVAPTVSSPHAGDGGSRTRTSTGRGIEMLSDIDMELTVELGRTRMLVRDLLSLAPGDVVELDRAAGSPADLLVSGRLIARGEVVVVDEDFGLRITHIVEPSAG